MWTIELHLHNVLENAVGYICNLGRTRDQKVFRGITYFQASNFNNYCLKNIKDPSKKISFYNVSVH
jgi:hypothetical protein